MLRQFVDLSLHGMRSVGVFHPLVVAVVDGAGVVRAEAVGLVAERRLEVAVRARDVEAGIEGGEVDRRGDNVDSEPRQLAEPILRLDVGGRHVTDARTLRWMPRKL